MKGFNLPFHNWVPKPLGIFIYVFMFVPALFISGAYTSNAGEMVGSLGIMTEHIQYANFATLKFPFNLESKEFKLLPVILYFLIKAG